ncbi:MAG: NAD(P)H-dependent oxidoreductase [Clostridiales bacterium]|nr:NAD(P)H-dependent oxidoreductase [Clostridiales bacterium]
MNKNILVAYFSASGVTAKAAKSLAGAFGAALYEIKPQQPYSKADLNWTDRQSRTSVEMKDPACRPAIDGKVQNMAQYDVIFVGFPIWWYVAPAIINTFLESYDLAGKTVIPFATSGGSPMGKTNERLAPSCPGAVLLDGKVLNGRHSAAQLEAWVKELKI